MRVHIWGEQRTPAVLVHGSILAGKATWSGLRPMSGHRRLLVADRRGYYAGCPAQEEDVEADVADLVDVIVASGERVHLVGHSRGTLPALTLARRHPELIRSLGLLEPPPFAVNPTPAIAAWWSEVAEMLDADQLVSTGAQNPAASEGRGVGEPGEDQNSVAFLRRFFDLVGARAEVPSPLPRQMQQAVALLRRSGLPAIDPSLASGPLGIPALVISGGHSAAFEEGCDHLAAQLGAQRVVLSAAGHLVQQHPCCAGVLSAFWDASDHQRLPSSRVVRTLVA